MPRRLLRLNALLVVVATGAAAYIAQEVTTPPRPAPLRPRPVTPAATAPPVTAPAPSASPGSYAVVASRNLFSPSRSEAPVSAQVRPAAALPKPTLHGVVLRDGTPIAYLEDPQTKRVAGYRLGDTVAGATVKAINADHVVLTRPEGPVDVKLRDPGKPRPAAPVATPPTAASPTAPGAVAPQPPTAGLPGGTIPRAPAVPGLPPQPTPPGFVPPMTPGVQPPQGPILPPRRIMPPNVLRRSPPTTSDAQP